MQGSPGGGGAKFRQLFPQTQVLTEFLCAQVSGGGVALSWGHIWGHKPCPNPQALAFMRFPDDHVNDSGPPRLASDHLTVYRQAPESPASRGFLASGC